MDEHPLLTVHTYRLLFVVKGKTEISADNKVFDNGQTISRENVRFPLTQRKVIFQTRLLYWS